MIGRVVSRFRLVAPSGWAVFLFGLVFAIVEVPIRYLELRFGAVVDLPIRPGRLVLIVGSVLLGVFRVRAFHPYFLPDYLRWLKTTPWTVHRPLPAGPVELVPEDSLAVGGLVLLSVIEPQTRSIELINVFLFSHMVTLLIPAWRTGVGGFGYCAALFLGLVPQLWANPWLDLVVLMLIYLLLHESLWRALARFPWATEGILVDRNVNLHQEKEFGLSCGWPHDRFHRDIRMARGIGLSDALLISMLAGWWVYSLGAWFQDSFLIPWLLNLMILVAIRRAWLYREGYAPPINPAGRFATLRWIIPGYDQLYLGPVLGLLGAGLGLALGRSLGYGVRESFAMAVFLVALPTFAAPPSLRRWRLTGRYRLVSGLSESNQSYVKVG
jgi:hypothetical protein